MFDTDKVIVVADVTKQPYLSVARFSGGCRVNGVFYAYVPQRDILGTRRLVKGIFGYGLRQIYSRR